MLSPNDSEALKKLEELNRIDDRSIDTTHQAFQTGTLKVNAAEECAAVDDIGFVIEHHDNTANEDENNDVKVQHVIFNTEFKPFGSTDARDDPSPARIDDSDINTIPINLNRTPTVVTIMSDSSKKRRSDERIVSSDDSKKMTKKLRASKSSDAIDDIFSKLF
jgi:hypothetical protein